MCIKSEFKEICLKLATNGWSNKGFLLTSKVCPQGVLCPCSRAIYMYKIIKNVFKIRFRRDHFETCNIWAKRKGLSVFIKILSPMDCLPLPWGYIHMVKHEKNVYKIGLQSNFFLTCNKWQSDKGFLLTSKVCPQGVVCPCLGAIYIYEIIKNAFIIRFRFLNLQWTGKVIRAFCWHQNFVPKELSVAALGLYTCMKSFKMCLKSYFKEIVLKLTTNGQWKGLSVDINICPQGVVCPCPGAIYMYKSIKLHTKTRYQVSVYRTTGPLVYGEIRKVIAKLSPNTHPLGL